MAIVKILGATTVAATAVDVVIAVAEMSATAANVAAAVRVLRFAACAAELVVTPVAIVTVHCLYALSTAVAAVSVMVAVAVVMAPMVNAGHCVTVSSHNGCFDYFPIHFDPIWMNIYLK